MPGHSAAGYRRGASRPAPQRDPLVLGLAWEKTGVGAGVPPKIGSLRNFIVHASHMAAFQSFAVQESALSDAVIFRILWCMEKQLSIRVPERLLRFLEAEAAREDRPVSGVVRRLIDLAARRASDGAARAA